MFLISACGVSKDWELRTGLFERAEISWMFLAYAKSINSSGKIYALLPNTGLSLLLSAMWLLHECRAHKHVKQHHHDSSNEQIEGQDIVFSYALVHPRTVVVSLAYADSADVAVLRAGNPGRLALGTVSFAY